MSRSINFTAVKSVIVTVSVFAAFAVVLLCAGQSHAKTLINNNPGGGESFVLSTHFPSSLSNGNSLAADDFVVPNSKVWQITKVVVPGNYQLLTPRKVPRAHVAFFRTANNSGPTDQAFRAQLKLKPSGSTEDGTLRLKTAMVVPPGRNWLAVQADLRSLTNTQLWFWKSSSVPSGLSAHVQNPGGAVYPACPTWKPVAQCSVIGPSLNFRLEGITAKNEFRELNSKFKTKPGGNLLYEVKVHVNNIGKLKISANGFKKLKKKIKKVGRYKFILKPKASTLAKYRAGQPITTRAKYKLPAVLPSGFTSAALNAETSGAQRVAAD